MRGQLLFLYAVNVMHKVAVDSEVQSCLDRFVEECGGLYSYSLK